MFGRKNKRIKELEKRLESVEDKIQIDRNNYVRFRGKYESYIKDDSIFKERVYNNFNSHTKSIKDINETLRPYTLHKFVSDIAKGELKDGLNPIYDKISNLSIITDVVKDKLLSDSIYIAKCKVERDTFVIHKDTYFYVVYNGSYNWLGGIQKKNYSIMPVNPRYNDQSFEIDEDTLKCCFKKVPKGKK